MKLDPLRFGLACGATSFVLWIIFSAFMFMTSGMMNMSGHMMNNPSQSMHWGYSPFGILFGLIAWTVIGGLFGYLVAFFYNALSGKTKE